MNNVIHVYNPHRHRKKVYYNLTYYILKMISSNILSIRLQDNSFYFII